jgi:hypothetical protein
MAPLSHPWIQIPIEVSFMPTWRPMGQYAKCY